MTVRFIAHPGDAFRLGDFLTTCFADPQWTDFKAAVAFVKQSGTKHLHPGLGNFLDRGGRVTITAGVDVNGTTSDAIAELMNVLQDRGSLFVFHNDNSSTFHPKIYLFRNDAAARIYIGSANLTEGGLYTNYEAGIDLDLDLGVAADAALLERVETTLGEWSTLEEGLCYQVTAEVFQRLVSDNQLPSEAVMRAVRRTSTEASTPREERAAPLFRARAVPAAPRVAVRVEEAPAESEGDEAVLAEEREAGSLEVAVPAPAAAQDGNHRAFIMTLQKTDVGVGQTTSGTQRRSPEIFIPLRCRDFDPAFWGWPDSFTPDPNWTGRLDQHGRPKMDRTNVMFRLGGDIFPVSIWYNPDKKDVRIRSEHIRRAGTVGDILYMERADGTAGYSYYVEIIPQSSARHAEFLALCTRNVPNSQKLWNYL